MDILRIKNKYAAVALFLMLSVALQAQDYGALKYMLQKRPANERFESNKFNEHLFFSALCSIVRLCKDLAPHLLHRYIDERVCR